MNSIEYTLIMTYSSLGMMCALRRKKHWYTKNRSNGKSSALHNDNKFFRGTIRTK